MSCQLSVVSFQLSVVSFQLSVAGDRPFFGAAQFRKPMNPESELLFVGA
jgi:hypothetical protein